MIQGAHAELALHILRVLFKIDLGIIMKEKLLVTSLVLALAACNSETNKETTTPSVTELATELDEKFFSQIKKAMDTVKLQELWEGYDYSTVPQYFIRTESGKAVSAFVVNPQSSIDGAKKLGDNEDQGLDIYQFEANMFTAMDKINDGNGMFEFKYNIAGKDYYLQTYDKDKVEIESPILTTSFALAVHEVFHNYQEKSFAHPPEYKQLDFDKFNTYPLTDELLALQLMMMDLLKDYPKNNLSKEQANQALKQYFVIVNTMLKLDPTAHSGYKTGLIYTHGLGQELFEGSALYIDQMVSRQVLSITKDNTFIFHEPFEMDKVEHGYATLMTKKNVQDYFAFDVFYYTGASAIWLLDQSGYDIKSLEKGIYPFSAAKAFLKLDEIEEAGVLSSLKRSFRWSQAQVAAQRYNQLQ